MEERIRLAIAYAETIDRDWRYRFGRLRHQAVSRRCRELVELLVKIARERDLDPRVPPRAFAPLPLRDAICLVDGVATSVAADRRQRSRARGHTAYMLDALRQNEAGTPRGQLWLRFS